MGMTQNQAAGTRRTAGEVDAIRRCEASQWVQAMREMTLVRGMSLWGGRDTRDSGRAMTLETKRCWEMGKKSEGISKTNASRTRNWGGGVWQLGEPIDDKGRVEPW